MKKVTLFLLLLVVALSMNSQTLLESDEGTEKVPIFKD